VRLRQLTKPTLTPVSLTEAKTQCAILDDTHDVLLYSLIEATTDWAEQYLGARLCTQTVMAIADDFPKELPVYPVQSVDSIAYDDTEGAEQTFADYYANLDGVNPILKPRTSWPAVMDKPGAVRITLTVGFTEVPASIKQALLLRVKELYTQRGESTPGMSNVGRTQIPVAHLLAPYRRHVV